jgi:uncharacterized membrane protein
LDVTLKKEDRDMKFLRVCVVIMVIVLGIGFTGCRGGKARVESTTTTTTTTLGQELMDLQKAYEQGIITEKEYKQSKERIIKERTKKK